MKPGSTYGSKSDSWEKTIDLPIFAFLCGAENLLETSPFIAIPKTPTLDEQDTSCSSSKPTNSIPIIDLFRWCQNNGAVFITKITFRNKTVHLVDLTISGKGTIIYFKVTKGFVLLEDGSCLGSGFKDTFGQKTSIDVFPYKFQCYHMVEL